MRENLQEPELRIQVPVVYIVLPGYNSSVDNN